jgi:glycosyltransferase involved in cell wall biosynthesis
MRILIITPYYLPGFKAGGPVRSLANLIDQLGTEIDFRVIAGDRDLGESQPYAGLSSEVWQAVGKATVAYVPMSRVGPYRLCKLIRESKSDALYVNSFFHPRVFGVPLFVRRTRLIPRLPVVLAPRGAFSAGALGIKAWRKRFYLMASRLLTIGDAILWHATSELEVDDIRRTIGRNARIALAPNLCAADNASFVSRCEPKQPGRLRLVFLARINRKKNLLGAMKLLRRVPGNTSLDIYGPLEDRAYWQACQAEIGQLPANVCVRYRGAISPSEVHSTLANYDGLLLPTLGENFGHAIIESLAAGCPLVISDRTPWRNLQTRGVGWDLPLESLADFERVLEELVAMEEADHRVLRENCRFYARRFLVGGQFNSPLPVPHRDRERGISAIEQSRRLFELAVDSANCSTIGPRCRAA